MKTMRNNNYRRWRPPRHNSPPLRFSPYAWAKLLFLRDLGHTEVGGFGITPKNDLLLVEDFRLVQQQCTPTSVEFDDAAVADFFDAQVDAGRNPAQFARLWIHTHPGNFADPSGTDEATFRRCFGSTDWSVMFILARGGRTYARLRFNVGPGGEILIPVEVDYRQAFPCSDKAAWEAEFSQAVSGQIGWPPDELEPGPLVKYATEREWKEDPRFEVWDDAFWPTRAPEILP